jgi:hypothetical protein
MNIEILFLASLFLIETTLLARAAVREHMRLAKAAVCGRNGISAGRRLLAPNID